ncbi:MAG: methyltransferase [Propionicimonas sp.]
MTLDPVSRLLLDEASLGQLDQPPGSFCQIAPLADKSVGQSDHVAETGGSAGNASILVIDDPGLANRLRADGRDVLAYCDDLRDERQLAFPALDGLDAGSLAGVELVLLRLPKSLGMLQDYAERVAAFAAPAVRLLAGGREKHLTRGMNQVLSASFGSVRASLGRQKSRVLHATEPVPGELSWPHTTTVDGLTLVSHAGAFAADRLDGGTRLLLSALAQAEQLPRPATAGPLRAVDLGCGTGILASWLAGRGCDVLAVDVSRAACAAAGDTAAANRVPVEVKRADRLDQPSGSIGLVVCNPPFHRGTAKDSTPGFELIGSALPALAPGGELWVVFNSHLPYLPFLRAAAGPTRVVARDRHYTVTRSVRTGDTPA